MGSPGKPLKRLGTSSGARSPRPSTSSVGKWKLIIVYWLAHGVHRFSDLQRRQPTITHKVLTESLRHWKKMAW